MKTVYVNKEGVICACTVEVPKKSDYESVGYTSSGDPAEYMDSYGKAMYNTALQACKESAVPFEDQDIKYFITGIKAQYASHHEPQDELYEITDSNRKEAIEFGDIVQLKNDTLYYAEADWEMVYMNPCIPEGKCLNTNGDGPCKGICDQLYQVARLKVSSPEDNKEQDDLWNEVGGIFFRAKGFKAYDHVLKELKEAGFMITRKPLS